MKENKKTLIISLVAFLLVVIAGVSYAYFSAIINGSESESTITMDAGELSITYSDNSNELNVTASKIYPREEEWITKEFKVTGNNTTELAMYYNLYLFVDYDEFLWALTYSLESENTSNNGAVVPSVNDKWLVDYSYHGNRAEDFEDETERVLRDYAIGDKGMYLGTGYFTGGENQEHNYTLKIYFKDNGEDQNEYQKAKFAAHIEIEGAGSVKAEPDSWSNAASGTLLAGIKSNYSAPSTPLTNPGKAASMDEEAVMAATQDDYGTSYYFRGNVQNNYVAFAGMCWRIVRVTGDGSIKLVLYNYNSTDCTETGDNLAFARYDGDTYTTAFNENYEGRAYIGYMYGTTVGWSQTYTYSLEHANINKSTILTNLETWYESKLAAYENKIADTIWCNDKSTDPVYGYIFKGEKIFYQNATNLVCPKDNDGGKLSKFTAKDTTYGNGALDYKIGLLTYDEAVYAGMGFDIFSEDLFTTSPSNYLSANINSESIYWTMTPFSLSANGTSFWMMTVGYYDGGGILWYNDIQELAGLRPAISLKSTTTITSGNGTASSPFVVN